MRIHVFKFWLCRRVCARVAKALGRITSNDFDNRYALKNLFSLPEEFLERQINRRDQQLVWHAYAFYHPEEIGLDVRAEMVLNGLGFSLEDFDLTDNGFVWSRDFKQNVCFAHGHGASKLAFRLWKLQKNNIPPFCCYQIEDWVEADGRALFRDVDRLQFDCECWCRMQPSCACEIFSSIS